jgi:hypothetical protein
MPYIKSEIKGRIREIMNSAEPVLDGITDELVSYEVKPKHYKWLLEQAEKVDKLEKEKEIIDAEKELLQAKWEAQGLMIQKLHSENLK